MVGAVRTDAVGGPVVDTGADPDEDVDDGDGNGGRDMVVVEGEGENTADRVAKGGKPLGRGYRVGGGMGDDGRVLVVEGVDGFAVGDNRPGRRWGTRPRRGPSMLRRG